METISLIQQTMYVEPMRRLGFMSSDVREEDSTPPLRRRGQKHHKFIVIRTNSRAAANIYCRLPLSVTSNRQWSTQFCSVRLLVLCLSVVCSPLYSVSLTLVSSVSGGQLIVTRVISSHHLPLPKAHHPHITAQLRSIEKKVHFEDTKFKT